VGDPERRVRIEHDEGDVGTGLDHGAGPVDRRLPVSASTSSGSATASAIADTCRCYFRPNRLGR
jgi:hypothetical protein